jgi:transposase InsO family protein
MAKHGDDRSKKELQAYFQTPIKPVTNTSSIEYKVLKFQDNFFKMSFSGYHHDGTEGHQGAVPHAYNMYKKIKALGMTEERNIQAFVQCCLQGNAIMHAEAVMNSTLEVDGEQVPYMDRVGQEGGPTFLQFLKDYIKQYGNPKARQQQKKGLPHCKKPSDCLVSIWKVAFPNANKFIEWLDGHDQPYTDEELVELFFNTFPSTWTEAYNSIASNDLSNETLESVATYMSLQETRAHTATAENHAQHQMERRYGKRGRDKYRSDTDAPGGRSNKSKNEGGRERKAKKRKTIKNACRKCKNGDGHDWKDCWFNRHNKNNKLVDGKVPDNLKYLIKGNPDKEKDGGNQAHVDVDLSDDKSDTGFDPEDSKQEQETINGTSSFDDITNECKHSYSLYPNEHHLDCFTIQEVDSDLRSEHGNPTSHTYMMDQNVSCGKHGSKTTLNEQKGNGPGTNKTESPVSDWQRTKSEAITKTVNDLSFCLFADDIIWTRYDLDKEYEVENSSNNNSSEKDYPNLSRHEIVPGADTPTLIVVVDTINGVTSQRPLRALVDTGSKRSFIYRSALPEQCVPDDTYKYSVKLLDQNTSINKKVKLNDIVLPDLNANRHISRPCTMLVAEAEATMFDMIIGQDLSIPLGIDVINSKRIVTWMDDITPFRVLANRNQRFQELQQQYIESFSDDEDYDQDYCHTVEIHSANYHKFDTDEVVDNQKHLSEIKKKDLKKLLRKFSKLFSGNLGKYPHRKIHLDIDPNAKPVYKRHYPIAEAHKHLFKEELDRLVSIGVLKRVGATRWAAPTFLIPKKDGTVRWISDLRELNKVIKRRVYPLPKIQDLLRKRNGYNFFTKLDISMQYYTFELDDESKEACTISTPFGHYQYQRLPMGCNQSPDYAQEIMESIFNDLEYTEVYIDDVGIFDKEWKQHLHHLEIVLRRLEENNFTINPTKCEWAVQETDFLGHWMTPTGLKPWRKKIEAILKLERPRTLKEVRSFIGAVNFYRDLYPKRSHTLAPLHELTAIKNHSQFKWLDKHQKAFDAMKAIMAKDAFIRYPDHNKPFHIFTDASDLQLGSVIMQDDKPVAFYSRKLNMAQRNYTTMEKELLSIVETLKEYRTMLYGCKELHVHTDHKNLTYANLNTQRVIRWRLYIEEFHPIFHYIKGQDNSLADALSRLPREEEKETSESFTVYRTPMEYNKHLYKDSITTDDVASHSYSITMDDDELLSCLLNFPEVDSNEDFVLDYFAISREQKNDPVVKYHLKTTPSIYKVIRITDLMKHPIYKSNETIVVRTDSDRPKVVIPTKMIDKIIAFYHQVLGHSGITRTCEAIAAHFTATSLKSHVQAYVARCDVCQRCKQQNKSYGELPVREAEMQPWSTVAVDLIGPWTWTDATTKVQYKFTALTIIDVVSNYCEIIRLNNKTAEYVAMQFENNWLARYPRPVECIFDPGTEFKGAFKEMLHRHGIKLNPTTVKNPQANAVCERLHQTVGDVLRSLSYTYVPRNYAEATNLIDTALATAAYAARTALHGTLGMSPGAMVFNRDMILDIPHIADFETLRLRRQAVIEKNNLKSNKSRISMDYQPGDKVLKLIYHPNKLEPRAEGPYEIQKVHTNGTITIKLTPFVTERVNIRRVRPYRE